MADDILNLVGTKGEDFEIIACDGQGVTEYYPAIDEQGNEKSIFDFDNFDEYLKHKVKKTRLTARYTVFGNPIAAEEYVLESIGCNAMAIGPHTLDVYFATDNPYVSIE